MLQVGQSLVSEPRRPLQSVGRPISFDPVACHFPELKLVFQKRVGERGQALKIERKVKGLSRQEKEALIKNSDSVVFKSLFMNEEDP